MLVLTNGGSEMMGMSLAVIDRKQGHVLLDHLLFSLADYGIINRSSRSYWDGVDEDGNCCSGSVCYCSPWHGHDWVGSPQGIGLKLGLAGINEENIHSAGPQFPLLCYYDATTGKASVHATREGVNESRLTCYSQSIEYEPAPPQAGRAFVFPHRSVSMVPYGVPYRRMRIILPRRAPHARMATLWSESLSSS